MNIGQKKEERMGKKQIDKDRDKQFSKACNIGLDELKEVKESQHAHITDRLDRIEEKLNVLLALYSSEPDTSEYTITPCSESGVCNQCGDPNKVLCQRYSTEENSGGS